MKRTISLATAALLSATAFAAAQNAQSSGTSQSKPSAYGSQYSGVAHPSDSAILANSSDVAAPATTPAAPTQAPTYIAPPAAAAAPAQNPDDGIVTTPVRDDAPATATNTFSSATTPVLRNHANDPDDGIVTEVTGDPNRLPEGTPFHARLVEEISAATITPGTPFTAQLTRDVMHMGNVVIPRGSYIHGRVTYVSAGRRIGGQSTMRLTPQEVVLPDGTHYQFRGIVTQTAGSNTKTDAEGYVIDKGHPVRTAAEYGMTAGSGAVIGGVVGGPVGAGVGTLIGAGVMTVHWLRQKNAAVLPAGSMVTFGLSSPLTLTPSAVASGAPQPAFDSAPARSPQGPEAAPYVEPKVVN